MIHQPPVNCKTVKTDNILTNSKIVLRLNGQTVAQPLAARDNTAPTRKSKALTHASTQASQSLLHL